MALQGSLRTMSCHDLLDWIERRGRVGELSIERGDTRHEFHLERGAVCAASSNVPGLQIGQLLLSRNLLSEAELKEAFATQAETGVFLGKVLLLSGALEEAQLKEVLELKIRESLWEVMSWEVGSFRFEGGARTGSEYAIRVPLRAAMDLGAAQVARWHTIRGRIPDEGAHLWITDSFAIRDPDASPRMQRQVDNLIDGVKRGLNVNQLVLENHGRRLQVLSILSQLIDRGALAIERRSELRSDLGGRVKTIEIIRGRAEGGDRIGALELTKDALVDRPDDSKLQGLHGELTRAVFAELSRELLSSFRVPKLLVDRAKLAEMDLNDHERYLAGRIDGRWDLLSLIRVAPIREVDALLTFRRLRERGIIEL